MGKNFTVCLYPGAGYGLFPFEVEAENEEDALMEAVKRSVKEDFSVDGFKWTEEQMKEVIEYYKKERKKYSSDFDFVTEYLNYHYISELDFFVKMDNVRIQKGWDLYDNSIKLKEAQLRKDETYFETEQEEVLFWGNYHKDVWKMVYSEGVWYLYKLYNKPYPNVKWGD